MPTPPFQIKPKSIPKVEKADHLVSESDREAANNYANSRFGTYSVVTTVVWICTLSVGFGGCMTIQSNNPRQQNGGTFLLILIFTIVFAIVASKFICSVMRDNFFQRKLQEAVANRLNAEHGGRVRHEALAIANASVECDGIYNEQPNNLRSMHDLLQDTSSFLNQSDKFFNERAFTPFWDSVEEVMKSLRNFNERVHLVHGRARKYYELLEGREHTFPAFPVNSNQIPSPEPLIQRLQEVIARAHRDFQFASIYEQRKTTSAIVAGFRSMQEAITKLREDIVSSISCLQDSLDSGLKTIHSQIVSLEESQQKSIGELREVLEKHGEAIQTQDKRDEKHQEFVKEALDNIQHHRKPRV